MRETQETQEINPCIGKIPWSREWQATPVFLPEKFHEHNSLAGFSAWGHKEQDTTEQLSTVQHTKREQQSYSSQKTETLHKMHRSCNYDLTKVEIFPKYKNERHLCHSLSHQISISKKRAKGYFKTFFCNFSLINIISYIFFKKCFKASRATH